MRVAELDRIVPPDLLVVAPDTIEAADLGKLADIDGVRETTSFAGGAVRFEGQHGDAFNVFGVDPGSFRAWTPPQTATSDGLWRALAGDQFVASFDASRERRLQSGARYSIEGREAVSVRLGAEAALGFPGVDALVSDAVGSRLGLVPDVGVLVNAPGADMERLTRAVRELLGDSVQVIRLRVPESPSPRASAPDGRPTSYLDLYRQAARHCPGLSWTVLAAIGQIESGHGRNNGPSSAGALGPMQFMPATWSAYGLDGDGDGGADIMNPYDAVPAAAEYLCAHGASGGGASLSRAIWHYNHANWYVQDVLALARAYARNHA